MTANLFGPPFGLCSLAQCCSAAATLVSAPAWPAVTLWIVAGLTWLITLVAYGVVRQFAQDGDIAIPSHAADFEVHLTSEDAEHWRQWVSSIGALV